MKIWLLQRLHGIALLGDGLAYLLGVQNVLRPRYGFARKTGTAIARQRGVRLVTEAAVREDD